MANRPQFIELDLTTLPDTQVILDVDGTLLVDGSGELDAVTGSVLRQLGTIAEVRLCSNAERPTRLAAIAEEYGVHAILLPYKKPDVRVLEGLLREKELVVIGDKLLTDGLLAKRAQARFIWVKRLRGPNDSVMTIISYAIDSMIGPLCLRIF
jgi:predicted HAD superfamily phosphohydrolase YqeG